MRKLRLSLRKYFMTLGKLHPEQYTYLTFFMRRQSMLHYRYKERIKTYAETFHLEFYRPLGKAVGLVEHVAKVGKWSYRNVKKV